MRRVLVLGGTAEGRALAARLHGAVDVISSLAGRVPDPALPVGAVRVGGFGGVEGLRRWLRDERVDAVVDATHPFAATITAHAARVCEELRLPYVVLARPAWDPGAATLVPSDDEAAKTVAQQGFQRVFLTTGRSGAAAFTGSGAWFLIRAVTAPDAATLPRRHQLVLSRGPYRYDDEYALMRAHRIDALVTKNSGGDMTRAKLDAAAALDIPVVMVDRPPLPPNATTVTTVTDAVNWVLSPVSSREGRDVAALHLAVCRRFSDTVSLGAGKWDRPTPCDNWDARAVVEHVIGFHDVLLLRPLGLKPERPRDDPRQRWELTVDRLRVAFAGNRLFGRVTELDATELIPRLTQDVLVHTWDLARAVEADDRLDPDWCAMFLSRLPADRNALARTGMFAAPVIVDDDADVQSTLLAALGRDPSWRPGNGNQRS